MRQKEVQRFDFALGAARRKELPRSLDQVVGQTLCGTGGGVIGGSAAFTNITVGIEAILESDDLDRESFFGEKSDGLLGPR